MSIRPNDGGKPPSPAAITVWPKAPKGFTAGERAAWGRLGEAVILLGAASLADLPMAGRCAQVSARVDGLFRDKTLKASTLASMLRIEVELLKQLGLSSQARRQVAPLPSGKKKKSRFDDIS